MLCNAGSSQRRVVKNVSRMLFQSLASACSVALSPMGVKAKPAGGRRLPLPPLLPP